MLYTLENRVKLKQIVKEINELKQKQEYGKLSKKVEELINIYLGSKIVLEVKTHIEEYVENWIMNTEQDLELQDTNIKGGTGYIRQGAWREGNEEGINLNYFHRSNISKYVGGFTCGNLKYEFEYPNQVIELTKSSQNEVSYTIDRYTQPMHEKIVIHSVKIADHVFELRKKYIGYSLQEEIKEQDEVMFYEETPFGNIEIDQQERKLELIKK